MMNSKLTNATAIAFVLENCELPTEVAEKLTKIKAQFEKKHTGERKPTKTQTENEGLKSAILDFMVEGEKYTITDIMKNCAKVADLSNQRVSALVRQLKDEHKVERLEVKRKAYFTLLIADEAQYLDHEIEA